MSDWNKNIIIIINIILPKGSRNNSYDLIKVVLKGKHIAPHNDYGVTFLKTGVNIRLYNFLRGVFVMTAKVKEYEGFLNL